MEPLVDEPYGCDIANAAVSAFVAVANMDVAFVVDCVGEERDLAGIELLREVGDLCMDG